MSAPQSVTIAVDIGQQETAGVGDPNDYYTCHGQAGEWRLESAFYMPEITTAAAGSNYFSLTIGQGVAGSSTDVSSALTNASTAHTLGVAREFTLTENTSREYGASDTIIVELEETGSSANIAGVLVMAFTQVRV